MLSTFTKRLCTKFAQILDPEVYERRDHLERTANTDKLTRLPNRDAFDLAEESAIKNSKMMFIFFDLNNFGKVNKTAGHRVGDELLKSFAAKMKEVAYRYNCRAFRYGGDEFVFICEKQFADQVRNSVEGRICSVRFPEFTVSISGSVGSSVELADKFLQSRKHARKVSEARAALFA